MNQDGEDPLLARLRETARDDRAPFPAATMAALDRLAAGTLGGEDLARLQQEAAGDERLAAAIEAFQPLSPRMRSTMADKLAERRGIKTQQVAAPVREAPARPPWWGRRWVLFATPMLAGAAAVAVLVGRPPSPAALARFDLEVSLNDSATRGSGEPRGSSAPGRERGVGRSSFVSLVGRPQVTVAGALAARAFVERGGALREVPITEGPSDSGVVRLEGRVEALFGTQAGPAAVHLVVGRPEVIAAQGESLARAAAVEGARWQRLTARFVISDRE